MAPSREIFALLRNGKFLIWLASLLFAPLTFTDPTGLWSIGKFFKKIGTRFKKLFKKIGNAFKKLARWVKENIRIIVTVVGAVVLVTNAIWGMGGWSAISASLAKSMVMGAAVGAASSSVETAIAGGRWDDILRADRIIHCKVDGGTLDTMPVAGESTGSL